MSWTKNIITTGAVATDATSVFSIDVDGDGVLSQAEGKKLLTQWLKGAQLHLLESGLPPEDEHVQPDLRHLEDAEQHGEERRWLCRRRGVGRRRRAEATGGRGGRRSELARGCARG